MSLYPASLPKVLFTFVISFLMLWSTLAQATESANNQTIILDKPAYFSTTAEDYIQLKPGNYVLAASPDSLQVLLAGETSARELSVEILTHTQKLTEPIAVSLSGKPDSDSADRHILALSLPGGFMYMAEGTYSGIRPRAVAPQAVISDPEQIYLEKPVHFFSAEGQAQVAKPGRYKVEQADQQIRLISGKGQDALLLGAEENTHEAGGFSMPIALSLPGAEEEDADNHYVVLLLPDGKSLEAIGTYSGIQPRGVFNKVGKKFKKGVKKTTKPARKTVKRAKKTVRRVGKQATKSPPSFQTVKSTGRIVGNAAKNQAKDTAKFGKKAAMDAKRRAEWAAKQAVKGVEWLGQQTCKLALKTVDVSLKTAGKALKPAIARLGKELARPEVRRKLEQAIKTVIKQAGPSIKKALEAAKTLNHPKNLRVLKSVMKKETLCERSPNDILATVKKRAGKPIQEALAVYQKGGKSGVRTRGVGGDGPSATIALGGGGGSVGGLEIGFRLATDFRPFDKEGLFFDIAGVVKNSLYNAGGGLVIGIFPSIKPTQTKGEFISVGVAAGGSGTEAIIRKLVPGFGGGIEFIFDAPWVWKSANIFNHYPRFYGYAYWWRCCQENRCTCRNCRETWDRYFICQVRIEAIEGSYPGNRVRPLYFLRRFFSRPFTFSATFFESGIQRQVGVFSDV